MIKIIKTSISINPRRDALQALIFAIRSLDTRCSLYVEYVVPPMLELIKNQNDNIIVDLLSQFGQLIFHLKKNIDPYIETILNIAKPYWALNDKTKNVIVAASIDLIQSIVNVMGTEYRKYLPETIPMILTKLAREINVNKVATNVQKLLHLTRSISPCIEFYVHLILTQFTEFLKNPDVDCAFKSDIVFTIYIFAKTVNLIDNVAVFFQSFVKLFDLYLSSSTPQAFLPSLNIQKPTGNLIMPSSLSNVKLNNQSDLLLLVLETIYLIAKQMNSRFFTYIPMFDRVFARRGYYSKIYEQLTSYCRDAMNINTSNNLLSPAFLNTMQFSNDENGVGGSSKNHKSSEPPVVANTAVAQMNNTTIQVSNLRVKMNTEQLTSREAWCERYLLY